MPIAHRAAFGLLLAPLLAIAACTRPDLDTPPKSVIFFTSISAELDRGARGVLDGFTEDAQAHPNLPILVEGYADSTIGAAANRTLSELRAQVVSDALVQRGIDHRRITLRPRSPNGTEPGLQSRRVELELGR